MIDEPSFGVKPGTEPVPSATTPVGEPAPTEPTPPVEGKKPEVPGEPVTPRRGTAAERIGELIRKNKQLEGLLAGKAPVTMPAPGAPISPAGAEEYMPQIQQIVENLRNLGFVRSEDVGRQIDILEARLILESEHTRLEGVYDGSDGRPKYDRKKIADFAYKQGIYDLDAAYKILHEPELTDWTIKQAQKQAGQTPYTEKPAKSARAGAEAITREAIARITATPEGKTWYETNRTKILSLLQKGELA